MNADAGGDAGRAADGDAVEVQLGMLIEVLADGDAGGGACVGADGDVDGGVDGDAG